MAKELRTASDGAVECDEGWKVRFINPELIEYSHSQGQVSCLVNVGYSRECHSRAIFASESTSMLAPQLREHLQSAASLLKGRFVIL